MRKITSSFILIITIISIFILSACTKNKEDNGVQMPQSNNKTEMTTNKISKTEDEKENKTSKGEEKKSILKQNETNLQKPIATSSRQQSIQAKFNDELCLTNEKVIFSFKTENTGKILSICVSKEPNYIVYRYGSKEKIELEYPKDKKDSWQKFSFSSYHRGAQLELPGIDLNYLSFSVGNYNYKVCHEIEYDDNVPTNVGVEVTDKRTNKVSFIQGIESSIKGDLSDLDNTEINKEPM